MSLIQRAKNILLTPKTEWNVVAGETATMGSLLTGYVLPLAILPAAAAVLGGFLLSHGMFGVGYLIAMAVISLIAALLGFVISTYVVDAFAPTFKSEKNLGASAQLVAYSGTAIWVAGILSFIPVLGWIIALAGVAYAIYLMYLGVGPVKKTPEDQRIVYVIISILVYWVITWVITALIGGILLASIFAASMSMIPH
ncbi:YIP1 family protein [Pseudoflavitalea sp. G-6-1-2]|uniref:Yip1 family protein n=1 Tax=Pseudoflavitalea sp. G-6-1-2 TaxID=2728841 RepID=UPI00146B5883|nr:Yip1 family protein [Pseudoflavitalea sp. G-6-1-2]NML20220.1 YIP1 family protein [Pseudoflavitalea sp. G-6-1-2]